MNLFDRLLNQPGVDKARQYIQREPYKVWGGFALMVFLLVLFLPRGPSAPDFRNFEAGAARKDAFFSYFKPLVISHNQEILALRDELEAYAQQDELGGRARRQVAELAADFGMDEFDSASRDDWNTLLRRVDVIPPSLALAQAANESAWGTSRFALEGNNYFGQWCFVKGCGIVPSSRNAGENHEVAEFSSPQESVERYMLNINRHDAYRELRAIRAELRAQGATITGLRLAEGLDRYSERGEEYIDELQSMITFNDLDDMDTQLL